MTVPPQPPPEQPSPNGAQPQIGVHPRPTEAQILIGQVQTPQGTLVVLQIFTVIGGPLVFYVPPEAAAELGNQMIGNAKAATSGLILPPGTRLG